MMDTVTSAKPIKRRARRIKGIAADARVLGCSRHHLALVLRGERVGSKHLLARYHQLKLEQITPAEE